MPTVSEGEYLIAKVALNSYSYATVDEDESEGSAQYVPYIVGAMYPSSGPNSGDTDVIVVGSGFVEDEND